MWDVCRGVLVLAASLFLLTACEEQGSINEDGNEVIWPAPAEARDPNTYICDPVVDPDLNQGISTSSRAGLLAQLYYLAPEAPRYTSVHSYIELGLTFEDVDIYFNQLNLPTRPFDRGFTTESGITLTTPSGDTLYEWFALEFHGQLKLRPDQPEGAYQLALLADDGAVLDIDLDGDGEYEPWINNDGTHPTKMGCATQAIEFSQETRYNIRLRYFQGPRYHISLVAMMRPWPAGNPTGSDPRCGQSGNSLFFDSTKSPPQPMPAYLELLTRGWEVLQTENYELPESEEENPCVEPEPVAPLMSVVTITNIGRISARVNWSTNIPATSQVEILDVLSGVTTISPLSTALTTTHAVDLTGLAANRLYRVTAISSSSGLQSRSTTVDFRTAR